MQTQTGHVQLLSLPWGMVSTVKWRGTSQHLAGCTLRLSHSRLTRRASDMIYSSTTGRRQALLPDHSTSLRVELLISALDRVLSELQRRFSDQALMSIIGSLAYLLCPSSSKFFIFEDIRPLLLPMANYVISTSHF